MNEFSLTGGSLLPYGIFGVRSTYRGWQMRYAHDFGLIRPQIGISAFNANGVTFYQGSLSLGDFFQVYDITFAAYLGYTANYYKPKATARREFPYTYVGGAHVGAAPLLKVTDNLYLRTDFLMGFNPGTYLYVGLGISYMFKEF